MNSSKNRASHGGAPVGVVDLAGHTAVRMVLAMCGTLVKRRQNDELLVLEYAENDLMAQSEKEERAAKAIAELQDRLSEARNDRKDIEIEFIALKKNYYQVKHELDQEKMRRES